MIANEDCRDFLPRLKPECIDLIFTSPPYAEQRKKAYGGVAAKEYIAWFLPIAAELKRVLKPTGSFFLNIKPHTDKGERSLYVYELVIALKKELGFMFIDEYSWVKTGFPGKLTNRFKNAWEPVYHFTKTQNIVFNPLACGTPVKPESTARAYRKQCGAPKNNSGMTAMNTSNIQSLAIARPSNVIRVNNVSNQFSNKQHHPATFPEGLCEFFIESFTNEGMVVLDPFLGSGTTCRVAKRLNRRYVGIELDTQYFNLLGDL